MKHPNLPVVLRFSRRYLWWLYANHDSSFAGHVLFTLIGGGISLFVILPSRAERKFFFEHEQVKATVLHKWMTTASSRHNEHLLAHGGRRRPKPHVSYEFSTGRGAKHQGEGRMWDDDSWTALRPGDALIVDYLPQEPERSEPHQSAAARRFDMMLRSLVGGLVLLLGPCGLILQSRWILGQIRLLESGRPAVGLLRIGPEETLRTNTPFDYLVIDARGESALHRGRLTAFPTGLLELRTNQPFLVVYDPALPLRHAPDVFRARPESPAEVLADCKYLDK